MSKNKKHKQAKIKAKVKAKSASILDQIVIDKDLVKGIDAQIQEHDKSKPTEPVEIRDISPDGEVKVKLEDKDGNQVLTDTDKAVIDKAKKAQTEYRQARLKVQEALRQAKQAMEALNGSDAIKIIVSELEAKIADKEADVDLARQALDGHVSELRDLQSEYRDLTGLDKKRKASNGKKRNGNGNGKFETKVISEDDALRILVTHKDSKDLFEYRLFTANGVISSDNWLKLRHQFIAHFDGKEENLTLRAFLSGLKNKISAVKTIS